MEFVEKISSYMSNSKVVYYENEGIEVVEEYKTLPYN